MGASRGQLGRAGGVQLALSTGSLYNLALDRAFGLAQAAGYDGVELLVDGRRDTYDVPYLRALMERWQTPILSVHSPFAVRVEGWPEASEGRVQQTLRLAEEVGAGTVVCHSPLRWYLLRVQVRRAFGRGSLEALVPWPNRAERRYRQWLRKELPAVQASSPVQVAVENMPAKRLFGQTVAIYHGATFAELTEWPSLVLDTTHWGTWGVDPAEAYAALKERIRHVHLSDYDGREHRVPFSGNLGLEELLRALRVGGYEGVVVVELNPWAVAGGDWSCGRLEGVLGRWRRGWLGFWASLRIVRRLRQATLCRACLERAIDYAKGGPAPASATRGSRGSSRARLRRAVERVLEGGS